MKKTTAIELLGGTPLLASRAMGYKSRHAVYMWPDELPRVTADRVAGVLARMEKPKQKKAANV